jgi:carbon storage regulator
MLVLSRKINEKIVIAGGMIVLTIVDIRGDKVRLGIEAPKDIDVHREEVHRAIQLREDVPRLASDLGGVPSPQAD